MPFESLSVSGDAIRRAADLKAAIARARSHKQFKLLIRSGPLAVCSSMLADPTGLPCSGLSEFFAELPVDEKHYWISSLYAICMPEARRRRFAAYFTPPHLSKYLIESLVEKGLALDTAHILDPAFGRAPFLPPLSRRLQSHS